MRPMLVTLLLLAASGAAQAQTEALRVSHLPVADVARGEPLRLVAQVQSSWRLASLKAQWRRPGEGFHAAPFGKAPDGSWAAIIDAAEVRGPVLEYYVEVEEKGAGPRAAFASAALPHPVLVRDDPDDVRRQDRLARHNGNTSRASVRGDYVSFGAHGRYDASTGLVAHADSHYQLEADYQYRLLGFVDSIRLGVVRVRGKVPPPSAFDTSGGQGITTEATRSTGFDYGFGELALAPSDLIGLTGKVILGADELGFTTGVGGSLRIGAETGAYARIGGQVIQRAGFDSFVELHWDTVPRWPIALGLHITDMPQAPVVPGATPDRPNTDGGAPVGIRALLDVGYEASKHVTLLLRAGYQARFATDGGPTLGGGLAVEW